MAHEQQLIMDHLAQDLSVALEESESCGAGPFEVGRKWGMRRRTRSAGNLRKHSSSMADAFSAVVDLFPDLGLNRSAENQSDDSSSTNSEIRSQQHRSKMSYQSDSDEISLRFAVARVGHGRTQSLRMKPSIHSFLRGQYSRLGKMVTLLFVSQADKMRTWQYSYAELVSVIGVTFFVGLPLSHSLESDSLNEHSPARPIRRKRKLKRMCVDEPPVLPCGKRKRAPRLDGTESCRTHKHTPKIKPLSQSLASKIEKYCQHTMEVNDVSSLRH